MRQREIIWTPEPQFDPIDTDRLRKLIENRQAASLWGQRHMITPRLVNHVWGDGRKLVVLYPIMHRPNHFFFRADSKIHDLDGDEFRDLLHDHVYEEIADQFYGSPTWWIRNINWGDGCSWDESNWPCERKRGAS